VLALSQLTRPRDGNLNRRPTKFDLKESGALEADAHTVLLIFRRVDETTLLPTGEDEIVIAKQRSGPLQWIHLGNTSPWRAVTWCGGTCSSS
jgi:replicative DNA helicase